MGKVVQYCEVCGVPSTDTRISFFKHPNKYLCLKHYLQFKRHGEFFKRTIYDKNEYRFIDDYIEFDLYNKRCKVIATGKLSLDDEWILKKYKLGYVNKDGREYIKIYLPNRQNKELHRFLLSPADKKYVDHINHDGLDNRRINLRICTNQQNGFNQGVRSDNMSGVKGVSYSQNDKSWFSYINVNGKTIYLGWSKNKIDVIINRLRAEVEYYKDFANHALIKQVCEKYNITKEEINV